MDDDIENTLIAIENTNNWREKWRADAHSTIMTILVATILSVLCIAGTIMFHKSGDYAGAMFGMFFCGVFVFTLLVCIVKMIKLVQERREYQV